MKKYASILAVLVLLLGFVASAYSAPAEIPSDTTAVIAKGKTQITLGGELRFRGMYGSNLSATDKDTGYESTKSPNTSYYDYRVMLNMEAKVSPNTTGFVELQSGTFNTDNVNWGSATGSSEAQSGAQSGARGVYTSGNTKDSNVTIRQAWIQYQGSGLLGVPAGIKVGRQLLKLGNGLFFDHTYFGDEAIVAFVQPVKELTIAGLTAKFREGSTTLSDDADAYVLLGAYQGKGFGISADITYVDDQGNKNATSAYYANSSSSTVTGGFANALGYGTEADTHLWNFGLRGNVDDIAGTGLGFRADVEFQTGKIVNVTSGLKEPKFKGWAALAGLDYKFKTIPLGLTLEYAIGSGIEGSGTNGKFDPANDDIKGFITALGQEQHYTFVYEYLAPSACVIRTTTGSNIQFNRAGLCNTQYVKLGGAYDITKDLKGELYGYWLRAVKDVAINDSTNTYKDKDLGWEVDAKVTYQIDKGLKYWVEGGYFWPGDAYKLSSGKDADDAWAVRHGIQLNF
ncbi:alginate export family protein [Thermodesulfovibrio yellowstonii]|uniref:alginate export family protein n=1 Tax=Thermodesulfovibrio yellowstonii TaxID=28262 RepID=UPI003C7D8B20